MADKLDWLNEHFVLQNNLTVSEVIEKQNYKHPFELSETALKYPMSEDFVKALVSQVKVKQASGQIFLLVAKLNHTMTTALP